MRAWSDHKDLVVGLSYFNGLEEIQRLDNSLPSDLPMIAIDGRYNYYKWAEGNYSTDGATEYLEKRPNTIVERYAGAQITKRQKYLDIAAQEGYSNVFILDSDEYIMTEWSDWYLFTFMLNKMNETYKESSLYKVWAWVTPEWIKAGNIVPDNTWTGFIRVIRDPGSIKYDLAHYFYTKKDDVKFQVLDTNIYLDGVRFSMDSSLRNPEQLATRETWAATNKEMEDRVVSRKIMDLMREQAMATAIEPQQLP
jgi:hypothetical protein